MSDNADAEPVISTTPDDLADLPEPREDQDGTIMVLAFEGWNDAGDAATSAIEHLQLTWNATELTEINPDPYYDFQVSRPTIRIVDGVTRRVEWPSTSLSVCSPDGFDRDVVLVRGPEPNMRWRAFCSEIMEHISQLDVSMVVTLGALLTDAAHTRPVPVTGSAYDTETALRLGLEQNQHQGAIGIVAVLQDACVQAGVPSISIWAGVPHYLSHPPSPKATVALLQKLEDILDVEIPLGALPEQAEEWQRAVDEMASDDTEIAEYVRSLEERGDAASEIIVDESSGEKIAAEFERYLRRRRPGQDGPGR